MKLGGIGLGGYDDPELRWIHDLARTDKGKLHPYLGNALLILENDPDLKGMIAYNEHASATWLVREPPWGAVDEKGRNYPSDLREEDVTRLNLWLQLNYENASFPLRILEPAIETAARRARINPPKEYLERIKLTWDGYERAPFWLSYFLGAEDNVFTKAVGTRWLISAVARIYRPGCKADCLLILEGKQGAKKSQALRALADPWFRDEAFTLENSRETGLSLQGAWIHEIGELASFRKGQIEKVKAFVSRDTDQFRDMWGRRYRKWPRQCVFAATTNEREYLPDWTGNRRYWPVRVSDDIDLERLREARDQLWAEAVARFERGERWWLDTPELVRLAEAETEARYERDIWEEQLSEWAARKDDCTIGEAFEALGISREHFNKISHAENSRMGVVVRRLGFTEVTRPREGESRVRVHYKPKADPSGQPPLFAVNS